MANACVCYVVDEGYLFPTLVSAIQARRFTSPEVAEVVIACIGPRTSRVDQLARIAEASGVSLISVPLEVIDGMHVMFGRLFVDRFLPTRFKRIVYIDGDTQIAGSLDPLVNVEIPAGSFMACRDPSRLFAGLSPARRAALALHHEKLGLQDRAGDYFNSGVLVIDRGSWPHLARASLDSYAENQALFIHPDQDALNVAVGEHCVLISDKWNFPGFLIGSKAEAMRQPHIYHFMSNPRPWKVSVGPWGARWAKPYADLLAAYPELAEIAPRRLLRDQVRYAVQQEVKIWLEYRRVGQITGESAIRELA
jgi:lipopolysaccharide biosynthesis glycosyltransferase